VALDVEMVFVVLKEEYWIEMVVNFDYEQPQFVEDASIVVDVENDIEGEQQNEDLISKYR
jgi:hypothetical protein